MAQRFNVRLPTSEVIHALLAGSDLEQAFLRWFPPYLLQCDAEQESKQKD
jgi:hypothetical protein